MTKIKKQVLESNMSIMVPVIVSIILWGIVLYFIEKAL